MTSKIFDEDFTKKVGMAALKEEATLRSVADEFELQLIQVLIWRTRCASEKTAHSFESTMKLSEAISSLIDGDGSIDIYKEIIFADFEEIEPLCEEYGEEFDYLVEQALEGLAENPVQDTSLDDRIAQYWLNLSDVNGAEPFEIKVRCAEYFAACNNSANIPANDIRSLAESEYWTDRLIAGWTARDLEDETAEEIKQILEDDNFTDDNGLFLVRESLGDYDQDDLFT